MMGKRKEVERELIFCQAKVESLEEQLKIAQADRDRLRVQVEKLQDALVSVRAPEAYRDQQDKEYDAKRVLPSPEMLERNRITQQVTTEYLNAMEGRILRTGEDLDDLLASALIKDRSGPTSLHGNDES